MYGEKVKEFIELQHELEHLNLGQLINILQEEQRKTPGRVVEVGIGEPHSWRGDYYDLAFEPKKDVTIDKMLADAESAVGTEYHGYKGGDYTMQRGSYVHIDYWGECNEVPMCRFVLKRLGIIK